MENNNRKSTGRKIKKVRTNNGHEFYNKEFDPYCAKFGIARHHSCAGIP